MKTITKDYCVCDHKKKMLLIMRYSAVYLQILIWYMSFTDTIFAEHSILPDVLGKKVRVDGFAELQWVDGVHQYGFTDELIIKYLSSKLLYLRESMFPVLVPLYPN